MLGLSAVFEAYVETAGLYFRTRKAASWRECQLFTLLFDLLSDLGSVVEGPKTGVLRILLGGAYCNDECEFYL